MNETDAVSCRLCLRADEYGSMVVVPIPVLGQAEPSDVVICRSCAHQVSEEYKALADELDRSEARDEPSTTT